MNTAATEQQEQGPSIQEFTNVMDSTLLKLKTQFDSYSTDILRKSSS